MADFEVLPTRVPLPTVERARRWLLRMGWTEVEPGQFQSPDGELALTLGPGRDLLRGALAIAGAFHGMPAGSVAWDMVYGFRPEPPDHEGWWWRSYPDDDEAELEPAFRRGHDPNGDMLVSGVMAPIRHHGGPGQRVPHLWAPIPPPPGGKKERKVNG